MGHHRGGPVASNYLRYFTWHGNMGLDHRRPLYLWKRRQAIFGKSVFLPQQPILISHDVSGNPLTRGKQKGLHCPAPLKWHSIQAIEQSLSELSQWQRRFTLGMHPPTCKMLTFASVFKLFLRQKEMSSSQAKTCSFQRGKIKAYG